MSRRTFALLQLCAWTLYGLVHYAAALPAVSDAERWHMAGWKVVRAFSGCLVSSALPFVYRRLPGGADRIVLVVAKVIVVSFSFGMLWSILDRALLVTLVVNTPLEVNWDRFPRGFELDYVFVMLAWSAAYLAARYWRLAGERRREALEQQVLVRDAQLRALAFQLHPHFLFNTLNSIRSLVAEDAERARVMVTRLSSFLRHSLRAADSSTLAQELDAVRAYLAIEAVRFENRLEVWIDSSTEAEGCLVPTLILQPLVENAIKHGQAAAGRLRIGVRAELVGGTLSVEVANSGALGAAREAGATEGLGLSNVRGRLANCYGDRQRFVLTERDGRVAARIEIREPSRANDARPDR